VHLLHLLEKLHFRRSDGEVKQDLQEPV
jgi:hypothetical protein